MAGEDGEEPSEQVEWKVDPAGVIFFLDGDLVRLIASNRGRNIVYLYNKTQGKEQTMLRSEFRKKRKRAYLVKDAAKILGVHPQSLYRYAWKGIIPPPMGGALGGEREFHKRSYYSEDDIFLIREIMTSIPKGRPRKDGLVVNNRALTEQEVRAKMGEALILYTRTKDGRYIPVWEENTY
jgi:hypothetical protein